MYFHQGMAVLDCGNAQDAPTFAGGFGCVFEQVGQDALHQILVGQRGGMAGVEPQVISHLGMAGLQERDALFQ